MRFTFLFICTIPFVILSILLDVMPTAYKENLIALTYMPIIFGVYFYIARLVWVGKATESQYTFIKVTVVLSLVALLFPGSSTLFLHGRDTHNWELYPIFAIGITKFFDRATTGEVMFFEILVIMFVQSMFAYLFFRKKREEGNAANDELRDENNILIYSDSLSWGIIPGTRQRLPFEKRWPGICELKLSAAGSHTRIIENCLNGRRTRWEDPSKPGRNGTLGLSQAVEMNSPLSLVVLMLGTNDFQSAHDHSAAMSAEGIKELVTIIQESPIEPGMPKPEILVIAPPTIEELNGDMKDKFKGAEIRSLGYATDLKRMTEEMGVMFFDSKSVITTSKIDGVHIDEEQHEILGSAIASRILEFNSGYTSQQ